MRAKRGDGPIHWKCDWRCRHEGNSRRDDVERGPVWIDKSVLYLAEIIVNDALLLDKDLFRVIVRLDEGRSDHAIAIYRDAEFF